MNSEEIKDFGRLKSCLEFLSKFNTIIHAIAHFLVMLVTYIIRVIININYSNYVND